MVPLVSWRVLFFVACVLFGFILFVSLLLPCVVWMGLLHSFVLVFYAVYLLMVSVSYRCLCDLVWLIFFRASGSFYCFFL